MTSPVTRTPSLLSSGPRLVLALLLLGLLLALFSIPTYADAPTGTPTATLRGSPPYERELSKEAVPAEGEELLGLGQPQQGSVTLATGVTMNYVRQGLPLSPVLIFVPGYTDSHRSFSRTLPPLPRTFQVYVLTMRGHGDSGKPPCCYSQADFVADIAAFMDAMGIQKATLAGHSMGSFIAQEFALTHPERLNGLILIGSGDHPQLPAVLELNDYIQSLEALDPAFVRDFQASTFYVPQPPDFIDLVTAESLKVPLSVWQQALSGLIEVDHRPRLAEISAPTLIVAGANDPYFPLAGNEALSEAIPNAHLLVYAETGHAPHVERPHRFSLDVTQFLLYTVLNPH